ncbi:VanZ family protein [Pseudobacteroides cellulosolvens]|uniref:VanZ family protein n=1 Tax=Pseudobacteroides cellulosolvens TaxID=35825 RepID=UPI00055D1E02|nr:VanZ family protein [Pseudobacteroides cellulosolvens]
MPPGKIIKYSLILLLCLVVSQLLFYYLFDDFFVCIINTSFLTNIGLRVSFAYVLYIASIYIIDRKISKIHIDLLAGIYFLMVLVLSLLREYHNYIFINLNPLTIINDFDRYFNHTLIILIGNLLIYVPLGMYIKYKFNMTNLKLAMCFMPYILLLEATQRITYRGIFDINDIITNIAGFVFGGICFTIFEKIRLGMPQM